MWYQVHINVEWCNKSRMIKYLFKYINKGMDKIRAVITENISVNNNTKEWSYEDVDEIKIFFDCRYLSVYNAV